MTLLPVRFVAVVLVLALVSCGGGGSGSSGVTPPTNVATTAPSASPTTSPTTSPVSAAAYTCPTSDTAASVARSASGSETARQRLSRVPRASQPSATLLAVTYDRATVTRSAASVTAKEQSLGASTVRPLAFTHVGRTTHILSVPAANAATIAASLRAQAGVTSVGVT